jgi:hypothetical protein
VDELLREVLHDVEDQILKGKGKERHGPHGNLGSQPWKTISDHLGSDGFLRGQILKKVMEAPYAPDYEAEMLGAACYCALAILWRRTDA